MAEKYSADWLHDQVREHGYTHLEHHDCSLCGYMTSYLFENGDVLFDAGCDCTRRQALREASYGDVAHWLGMQSSDDIRDQILKGLRPISTTASEPDNG